MFLHKLLRSLLVNNIFKILSKADLGLHSGPIRMGSVKIGQHNCTLAGKEAQKIRTHKFMILKKKK